MKKENRFLLYITNKPTEFACLCVFKQIALIGGAIYGIIGMQLVHSVYRVRLILYYLK